MTFGSPPTVRSIRPCGIILALTILGSCAEGAGPVCEVADPEGPVVRVTPAEVAAAERWEVMELWRSGGLHDDSQLTMPTSGRVSMAGVIAIPDFAAGEVWLFGPDGEWRGSVGGRGQGPGELSRPLAAAWTAGGELLVLDAGDAKLEGYDLQSGTARTLRIPPDLLGPVFASGEVGWFGLRGDGVAFLEFPAAPSDAGLEIIRFARSGPSDERHEVVSSSAYPEGQVPAYNRPSLPEWPRTLLAAGTDGWARAPESSRYEIVRYGVSDEPVFHLCVAEEEVRGRPARDDHEIPESLLLAGIEALEMTERVALFSRMVLDRDGRLWIERDLPRLGATFDRMYGVPGARLDVISAEGELLGRVDMPEGLRFQDARGDSLWAFAVGEFEEVEVVGAEIRREGR